MKVKVITKRQGKHPSGRFKGLAQGLDLTYTWMQPLLGTRTGPVHPVSTMLHEVTLREKFVMETRYRYLWNGSIYRDYFSVKHTYSLEVTP